MADSQVLKALLPDNPLCGISTYKDTLNLATGACIRQIKKLVLDGTENWNFWSGQTDVYYLADIQDYLKINGITCVCSHYPANNNVEGASYAQYGVSFIFNNPAYRLYIVDITISSVNDLKSWLATQYANGTPVTVWYILATPTTETITVPSGLSGTEEGYLNQSGTPTPTNPIYPTANNVEVWLHSLRKLTIATEAVENPLYSDGTAITAYTIKGNTVQNGTPTPSNPVDVNGVGIKTENLLPDNFEQGGIDYNSGSDMLPTDPYFVLRIRTSGYVTLPAGTYTISSTAYQLWYYVYSVSDTYESSSLTGWQNTVTFTINSTKHIRLAVRYSDNSELLISNFTDNIMLNVGSTAKPYEPYGYEIPISSGGTTTNVYLGEVQSTRQIKKLVLTGEEQWYLQSINDYGIANFEIGAGSNIVGNMGIASHYKLQYGYISTIQDEGFAIFDNGHLYIRMQSSVMSDLQIFKQYLTDQYSNGTPVTVWYVLTAPETAAVNEPLMKIGDYADTLSNATAIPTTEGANSITVDTTVQPSEFTATWTGWHNASVKEWDGSQWNE